MKQSGHTRVLAILGSPNGNGINAQMMKTAVDEAGKNGCIVDLITVYEKDLEYCKGCLCCKRLGRCVIRDDISEMEEKIKSADIVILSSPVYWGNVPGPVKNMFDRLRGTAMEDGKGFPKPKLKGKKCILMTSCITPQPFAFLCRQSTGALRAMKEFFSYAGIKCMGTIVTANVAKAKTLRERKMKEIERKVRRALG